MKGSGTFEGTVKKVNSATWIPDDDGKVFCGALTNTMGRKVIRKLSDKTAYMRVMDDTNETLNNNTRIENEVLVVKSQTDSMGLIRYLLNGLQLVCFFGAITMIVQYQNLLVLMQDRRSNEGRVESSALSFSLSRRHGLESDGSGTASSITLGDGEALFETTQENGEEELNCSVNHDSLQKHLLENVAN